ncbi:MAG: TonB-dependent receptor [Chloroherpetonaceae bacterium]|nr:TonB-dependent receptor [Chloroherpetonaceae bacterium]
MLLRFKTLSVLRSIRILLSLVFLIPFSYLRGTTQQANPGDFTTNDKVESISGIVIDRDTNEPITGAILRLILNKETSITDLSGRFTFSKPIDLPDSLRISAIGYEVRTIALLDFSSLLETKKVFLNPKAVSVKELLVRGNRGVKFSTNRLGSVEGTSIYEAKKSEVISIENLTANLATNNARQIYSRISGLNVWENDGAGIQLAIGARGLSPNRSSNFNVRQNGYDISADALGYPESYYTPPAEALDKIEVIRGAASLQYGTQFGGMLNFIFKRGPEEKAFEFTSRMSGGSFGFFNTFNSIGGSLGTLNYYGFYQFKRGDGWRPNSGFDVHTAFSSFIFTPLPELKVQVDLTYMTYLAQQPGGLTDSQFERDARQSFRPRNWFSIDWKVASLLMNYRFSGSTELDSRTFGLLSSRSSLGNLDNINRLDLVPRIDRSFNRTLIEGQYENIGNETRLIHKFPLFDQISVSLFGIRLYSGTTLQRQGDADSTGAPNFTFLNPDNLENSDYRFPNKNVSLFTEQLFRFSPSISITLGARYEYINTGAQGYFRERAFDFAGNIIADRRTNEVFSRERDFAFFGGGISYSLSSDLEVYGNLSQNFRSITFSDLRIDNPNFRVDPNITDERGFNAELGFRGNLDDVLIFDVSIYLLRYQDRINNLLLTDTVLFNDYRFRTNVGDTRTIGLESLLEADLFRLFGIGNKDENLLVFSNLSIQQGQYVSAVLSTIVGNEVELIPPLTLRSGITYRNSGFRASLQYSFVDEHFTDATNTRRGTGNAVSGLIPSYQVLDFSFGYSFGDFTFEGSVNNLTDAFYYTRRAESYPGPGIIPADGRAFFLTFSASL